MATILYAWELGGGLGHVLPFRPIGQELVQRGHRVVAALRDLKHAERAFQGTGIRWVPAPYKNWRSSKRIDPMRSFAHILHNTGFGSLNDISRLTHAWRHLLDQIRPDLAIADHSPSALLALRGTGIPYVTFGTGFFCPPEETPWPPFDSVATADLAQLARDEQCVLDVANAWLQSVDQPPLSSLSQLYADAAERLLTTAPELDHYGARPGANYCGSWPTIEGERFTWPSGSGPRVFAYFKDFAVVGELLQAFGKRVWPTVIYGPELATKPNLEVPANVVIAHRPLSLAQVAAEADLILQNANHATLLELLLAGRPAVSIPITIEQYVLAKRVTQLGVGLAASPYRLDQILAAVDRLHTDSSCATQAQQFAARYSQCCPANNVAGIVQCLTELVTSRRNPILSA